MDGLGTFTTVKTEQDSYYVIQPVSEILRILRESVNEFIVLELTDGTSVAIHRDYITAMVDTSEVARDRGRLRHKTLVEYEQSYFKSLAKEPWQE